MIISDVRTVLLLFRNSRGRNSEKKNILPFDASAFICHNWMPGIFRADASTNDLNSLLDERQTDCWVEGELFGDLVLGSRGTIQFIYLDAKLSKAISAEQGLAPWVDDLNQYYGSPETRKKALFIANLEAKQTMDR